MPSNRVLEQASRSPLSAYDCEFVVLVWDLSRPLVTADGKILASCPDLAIPLEEFAVPEIPPGSDEPES